jgi:protoporphyrinogen oxidase
MKKTDTTKKIGNTVNCNDFHVAMNKYLRYIYKKTCVKMSASKVNTPTRSEKAERHDSSAKSHIHRTLEADCTMVSLSV